MFYQKYWHLRDMPFRPSPDPRYFFFLPQYEEALAAALYVLTEGAGGMLLTGDCGCGKTLITRVLVDELDPERFEVALLTHPNLKPSEFLAEILRQYGLDSSGWDKSRMLAELQSFLIQTRKRGAQALVIVDEGQLVEDTLTLEEIRLLLNFQENTSFYLTLILVGQPELRDRVESKPQLQERLSVRHHLSTMSPEATRRYLEHRLERAGGGVDIFTGPAEDILVAASGGIPRRLNYLADRALLAGYSLKLPLLDDELVGRVVKQVALA
ncbi:MAG: AAA family ATPase [Planctomycetota bacterium]|jgi:general secretion pathway protein A|nr:AAA family ATPase [Planctomycetota bacterium]